MELMNVLLAMPFVILDWNLFLQYKKRDIVETAGGVIDDSGLSPTDNVSLRSISSLLIHSNRDIYSSLDFFAI